MKRQKFSIKNLILKGITNTAALIWCVSACLLDSECWVLCLAAMAVSTAWISLFVYANYCWRNRDE